MNENQLEKKNYQEGEEVCLYFFKGNKLDKEGKPFVVARLPGNGMFCIVSNKSNFKILADTIWNCKIIALMETKAIVEPIKEMNIEEIVAKEIDGNNENNS